jgi:DNA-binding MarR family transcriptional regulator
MQDRLSTDEMRLWHAWKVMGELVRARIVQEITSSTGLSDPDYGVLSRLDEIGNGQLRQQTLAESMHWSKSRLSHHLTRMQERGLVVRQPSENEAGILIVITPIGREALNRARPVHAQAVRRHLLDRLTPDELETLNAIAARLENETF